MLGATGADPAGGLQEEGVVGPAAATVSIVLGYGLVNNRSDKKDSVVIGKGHIDVRCVVHASGISSVDERRGREGSRRTPSVIFFAGAAKLPGNISFGLLV